MSTPSETTEPSAPTICTQEDDDADIAPPAKPKNKRANRVSTVNTDDDDSEEDDLVDSDEEEEKNQANNDNGQEKDKQKNNDKDEDKKPAATTVTGISFDSAPANKSKFNYDDDDDEDVDKEHACVVTHVKPTKVPKGVHALQGFVVVSTVAFMRHAMTHALFKSKNNDTKKDYVNALGPQFVQRVCKIKGEDGEPLEEEGNDGEMYPVYGLFFVHDDWKEEQIKALLSDVVGPAILEAKNPKWKLKDEELPLNRVGNKDDYKVVEKITDVLADNNDIEFVVNKATNSNFRKWANEEGNVYTVWNSGELPVALMHKCSVKDSVMDAKDKPRYLKYKKEKDAERKKKVEERKKKRELAAAKREEAAKKRAKAAKSGDSA